MNRTLIAPTPSITTDTPPSAATSQREPAMIRRPSATAPPRPWDFALRQRDRVGHAELAADAVDEHDRDEERRGVDDEDGPRHARRRRRSARSRPRR